MHTPSLNLKATRDSRATAGMHRRWYRALELLRTGTFRMSGESVHRRCAQIREIEREIVSKTAVRTD
eukprot:6207428-Pleurochrysis_carterae.AAC.1